jgi:hypothetical protein
MVRGLSQRPILTEGPAATWDSRRSAKEEEEEEEVFFAFFQSLSIKSIPLEWPLLFAWLPDHFGL